MSGAHSGRVAVVDVGSNSLRLFLCHGVGPEGPEGERTAVVTGLRRGAAADGAIAADALERLDRVLADYGPRVEAFAPRAVLALGTSAVRDAPNRGEVARVAAERLGVELRVLSGDEEAALSFAGARLAVAEGGPALVVDIGGGSTELIRGTSEGQEAAVSLQLGASRGTERHLRHDPPRAEELAALRADAAGLIAPALAAVGGPAPVVGVAGTMTTLAAIHHGRYDPALVHGTRLTARDVEDQLARLAALPLARRREVPGLDPARAPLIVAGAAIAACVLEVAGAPELSVSERDLLDGAALAALAGAPPGTLAPSP